MKIFKSLLIVSIVVFLSFATIYSELHVQASELRAMPAPITDRGSIEIPEKVFPEGKGVPIPIYVPPVVDGSNAFIKDDWNTVVELKGQEISKAATFLAGGALTRGDSTKAQQMLDIGTEYKITIQESLQGEQRAIIQTSGIDRSLQRITETISSKIIKKPGREVHILNVDRSRKDDPYIAYVSLSHDKKTVVTPKVYPEDKVTIIHSIGTFSKTLGFLLGKYQDTEINGKELVNYLTPIFRSVIDIGQLDKMFSDEKVIAAMSVNKMDTSVSRLEQIKETIKETLKGIPRAYDDLYHKRVQNVALQTAFDISVSLLKFGVTLMGGNVIDLRELHLDPSQLTQRTAQDQLTPVKDLSFTQTFSGGYEKPSESPFKVAIYRNTNPGSGMRTGIFPGNFSANYSITATSTNHCPVRFLRKHNFFSVL